MVFDFPAFSLIFLLGGLMAVFYASFILMRRPTRGSVAFTIFALVIAVWAIFRFLEAGAVEFEDKVLWGKMMSMGSNLSGVTWLIFCLSYTASTWLRRPMQRAWLFFLPLFSYVMVWANDRLHWYWPSIYASPGTRGAILVWEHGWAFWIMAVFNYIVLLSGVFVLLRYLLKNRGVYRWQLVLLIIGTLVPIFSNLVYILGLSPVKGLDLTPFAFCVTGAFYAVTIFRFRLLDVVPVARGVLVEKIPDAIIVIDNQRQIMDVNPSGEKLLGSKRREITGRGLEQVWPELEFVMSSKIKQEAAGTFDLAAQGKMLEVNYSTIRDNKQQPAGQLIAVRDVTARRQMEQSLRESQTRYATLVEQSNEGVLIVQKGIIRFCNSTIAQISGYSREEILNQTLLMLVDDKDRQMVSENYRKRQTGEAVPDVYEITVKRQDGEKRNVELSIGTIIFEGATANIISIRDITERKSAQLTLESLYEEEKQLRASLQEEMEKRSKYTRALVHELNTPLTSILAAGELLETEVKEPTLVALVKNIQRASNNLKQRIDELIELARGEIGLLKIMALPLNMAGLLNDITNEMRPLAQKKGLDLKLEIRGELPLALGDAGRLRQVMFNLIGNAIKFTQRGGIEVKAEQQGSLIEVSVVDSGRGISHEEQEFLFDPYRRKVNEGQDLGGLGIGLTLSKMFIELHGGTISVNSAVGQGSNFRFTVPVYSGHDEARTTD